jgi:hypothetical protein
MAVGTVIFAVAFVDLLFAELSGRRRRVPRDQEPAHVE